MMFTPKIGFTSLQEARAMPAEDPAGPWVIVLQDTVELYQLD